MRPDKDVPAEPGMREIALGLIHRRQTRDARGFRDARNIWGLWWLSPRCSMLVVLQPCWQSLEAPTPEPSSAFAD
ncbi:MAG: hypothetical protein M1816_002393 [Peltula sp. TS41687]|nr:MAG: hypothetical protein M1816_002393 [Peltula sp. TS41687]